jgi:hypothetical protein
MYVWYVVCTYYVCTMYVLCMYYVCVCVYINLLVFCGSAMLLGPVDIRSISNLPGSTSTMVQQYNK